jgi:GNAT superfamily N-acetyltransferase
MDLVIRSLTPGLIEDFLTFFDRDAFVDNPDWAGCYCQFYLTDHKKVDWDLRTADQNRSLACQRIGEGSMHGYLAFLDGKVVGWCNAAPRQSYPALVADPDLPPDDAALTGSIVCFLVDFRFRGRGVAKALLEAACQGFVKAGLKWAEGYPRLEPKSQASNYHGPLWMYKQAGFEICKTLPDFAVVRKPLVQPTG